MDSQYIGNYDGEVYARHIQFTEDQGATDTATLNKVASKYFTSMNAGVDKPKVSAEVNIRKLDNQAKFKNFRQLGIFDSFTVFHERYNINLEMTVNKVVYDGLLEQIESIEAGDPKFTFFEEQQNQFTEVMKKVPTKQYNSVFTDYVTKLSVVMMEEMLFGIQRNVQLIYFLLMERIWKTQSRFYELIRVVLVLALMVGRDHLIPHGL